MLFRWNTGRMFFDAYSQNNSRKAKFLFPYVYLPFLKFQEQILISVSQPIVLSLPGYEKTVGWTLTHKSFH